MADLLMIGLGVDTRRLRDGERALGRLQRAGNNTENALKRMAGVLTGAFTANKILEYADAYTQLENKLKLVTNSMQELGYATDDVLQISQRTGQAAKATGDLYFKVSQNADKLGISMTGVATVTETVAKTLALSGASTQGAEAAILQFGQALASGAIRGDEFNSVAENAPALMDALSRALGVTKGELRNLAAQGALTSDVLITAIQEQSQEVDKQFGKTATTIGQAFTKLTNSMMFFVGQLNEATGASVGLVSSLEGISRWIDSGAPLETAVYQTKLWGYAFDDTTSAIQSVLVSLGVLKNDGGQTATFLTDAFTKLPVNIAASFKIANVEVKSFFDYVKEGLIISAERWRELDNERKNSIAAILAERDARLGAGNAAVKAVQDEKKAREDLRTQKEFESMVDGLIAEQTRKTSKELLQDSIKKAQAEKDAKKADNDKAKAAEQLNNAYKSLLLSQKEQIELWGDDTALAKINFDLKNTELSKLLPKEKELLRIQAAKIDALKAEEAAKQNQKQTDDFMAQQGQELDALRNSYATKNEIVYQAYLAREAIIQRAEARGSVLEAEAAQLRHDNEKQLSDERVAIAKEEADKKKELDDQRLNATGQLFGNLATLMQTENRKLFEIGKAAAIAQAIVNTATAITNALAVPPYPLGLALASTAGIAGAVQIAAIQNQQISGARAMGGDVQAGNQYLVGERGPEVVTMGGNGHVTPNHKLGGGDIKVTVVNQTTGKIDKVEERRMPDGELILTVIEAVAAQTLDPNSRISRNQAAAFGLQRRR